MRPTALVLLLALLVAGCAPEKDTATRAAEAGVLIINNSAEPAGLDPQVVTGTDGASGPIRGNSQVP